MRIIVLSNPWQANSKKNNYFKADSDEQLDKICMQIVNARRANGDYEYLLGLGEPPIEPSFENVELAPEYIQRAFRNEMCQYNIHYQVYLEQKSYAVLIEKSKTDPKAARELLEKKVASIIEFSIANVADEYFSPT